MRVTLRWGAALLGVGLLGGCAHEEPGLQPASAAQTAQGGDVAANVEGVHVEVDGDAWEADPENLDTVVPLQVTVKNASGRPLRLRFREFALVGPQGSRLAVLPPLTLDGMALADTPVSVLVPEELAGVSAGEEAAGGSGLEPVPLEEPLDPGFEARGYYVSPTYGDVWRGLEPWEGSFTPDPLYYDTYLAQWPVSLPTEDMVRRAIPEGVLAPGGEVSGFLFFQDVPQGMESVTFQFDLVDADSEQQFGTVRIPLPREAA